MPLASAQAYQVYLARREAAKPAESQILRRTISRNARLSSVRESPAQSRRRTTEPAQQPQPAEEPQPAREIPLDYLIYAENKRKEEEKRRQEEWDAIRDEEIKMEAIKSEIEREEARGRYITYAELLKIEKKPRLYGRAKLIDVLLKAEKSAAFENAMLAAEAAARSAPPGKQEELAAAAGAKSLQEATVTSVEKMKQTLVDGNKLIEVVGYIGITKPKEKKQG